MNKKGSFELAGEMVIWLFRISILLIVLVIFAIIVGIYVSAEIDTYRLEHKIIVDRLLIGQGCLNFNEEGRWQAYGIDAANFNSDSLDDCINVENAGVRINLDYNDKKITAEYNKAILDYLEFCKEQSRFRCSHGRQLVRVKDDKMYNGLVEYWVITKIE